MGLLATLMNLTGESDVTVNDQFGGKSTNNSTTKWDVCTTHISLTGTICSVQATH